MHWIRNACFSGQSISLADSKHPQADAGFFQKREFCFTLDGDIFVRYQSFKVNRQDIMVSHLENTPNPSPTVVCFRMEMR